MTNKARKVRGINVILDASKRKKEIPVQFADNWNGELQRIGFKAVWRHCNRYGVAFSLEDTRDAVAEAVASLWEEGKLQATLEHDALSLEREEKIRFCLEAIRAYRRYIHPGKKQSEFTLDVILGMERYYQWQPNSPEEELNWIELKESLRQTLSNMDYAACQLLLQGYSKGEAARLLKLDRRTIRRRLDRLPAGKLLKILRT
jgi:DNA-directed RNA polymerase specialized sigma24 family protein